MTRKFNPSKLILIILIPILILLISFQMNAFDTNYYHKQFEKNNVYNEFTINKTQLHQVNVELLDYLQVGQGEVNITYPKTIKPFFNQKETQHLVEVKEIIQGLSILFYFFLTIFIILTFILYFKNNNNFTKNMIIILISGNVLNIISTLLLSWTMFTNFSKFFINFHLALFESDTWLLNPLTDNLIKMFPKQFFYDIGFRIVSDSVIYSIVLILILYYIYRKSKSIK